jgi:hypothetical protein
MNLHGYFLKSSFSFVAAALLVAVTSGCGQQRARLAQPQAQIKGVVDDWSTPHVKFSNPGTEEDAIKNGRHEQWLRIVNNPRYQMQQLRRSAAWANRLGTPSPDLPGSRERRWNPPLFGRRRESSLNRDWTVQIASAGSGSAFGAYPAEYGVNYSIASCSDFVAFPVDIAGSGTQANLVGFNNLYSGTCSTGTVPTVAFAYYVGTGSVQTSPILSEDGTKVAFVETTSSGSIFHVLTLGTTGSNGSAYNSPVQPCTVNGTTSCATNNAVDTNIAMYGSAFDLYSSPFVDYTDDVAYVGDADGNLHKFTCVFNPTNLACTLAEVTTGWPVNLGDNLTGPVYDSVSEHIFAGSLNTGNLYCIDVSSGTPEACSISSVSVGEVSGVAGLSVFDAPIVDSTAETVFSEADSSGDTESILMQANVNLGNVVQANMGVGGTHLYNGDFDNTYYNSSAGAYSGYMYFCGGGVSAYDTPTLYRIGFNSSGTMNSTNDGSAYQLATATVSGTGCTPLTEVYNTSTDYLFLGVAADGAPAGCEVGLVGEACLMSFELDDQSPYSFPSGPTATYLLGGSNDGYGSSGIIIDNVSSQSGASQIYFSNNETGNATQASQNGLN